MKILAPPSSAPSCTGCQHLSWNKAGSFPILSSRWPILLCVFLQQGVSISRFLITINGFLDVHCRYFYCLLLFCIFFLPSKFNWIVESVLSRTQPWLTSVFFKLAFSNGLISELKILVTTWQIQPNITHPVSNCVCGARNFRKQSVLGYTCPAACSGFDSGRAYTPCPLIALCQ